MYIITISEVAPALQFFYLVVMYISAYPIIMSLRATNIYEERSLGQTDSSKYGRDSQEDGNASKSQLGVGLFQGCLILRKLTSDIGAHS